MTDISPNRNYTNTLAVSSGVKGAGEKWFSTDLIPVSLKGTEGIVLVLDYNISDISVIEYTIDGDTYIAFEPDSTADYKKIRLYSDSQFNVRAVDAITLFHCFLCEN